MRRLFLAITGLLLLLFIALLLALRSQDFVVGAAQWVVAAFSDFRLELRNPKVDFYAGRLSADEIHVVSQAGDGPALLSVLGFAANFAGDASAHSSQAGSSLRAGSVLIYVSDSDASVDPQPMQWLGYLGWLPARLDIDQVHLVTTTANTWIFPLKHLHGERLNGNDYRLTADADYGGEPLGITLDVLALDKDRWGAGAEVAVRLSAPESGSDIKLAGTLQGSDEFFNYTLELDAVYRDVSEFLKGFEGGAKLAGKLRLHGTMVGDTSGFVLSEATFVLDNMPEYGFEAGGWLNYRLSGESAIELLATGELASLSYLVDWVDLDVGDFGRAQSSVHITGTLDRPVLEEFRLLTGNAAGLTISLSGQLNLFDAGPDQSETVFFDLHGPSLAVLSHWLGDLPYEPGSWSASGLLSGDRQKIALRDIVLETGTPETVTIRATGAIETIALPQAPEEKIAATGINLSLQAFTPDSAQLGALLDLPGLPPYLELAATMNISGTGTELQLSDGSVSIDGSDLAASIGPLSAALHPAAEQPLSSLAAPVRVELSDVAALSQYLPQAVPVLGPLHMTARLAQKGDTFQLLDIAAAVSEGDLSFNTNGRIDNLATFSGVSLNSTFSGLDMRTVLSTLLPDFGHTTPLAQVGGSFKLRETGGVWSVSRLALAGGNEHMPLQFTLAGEIDDLAGLVTANLESKFSLRDPLLLESLGAPPLQEVGGSLAVTTSGDQIHGTLKADIGDTLINADGRIAISDDRVESLYLTIDTPHLHLQDFGFTTSGDQASAPADPSGKETPANLLAQLRAHSPPFPVDLTLQIDGMSGDNSSIDSLAVRVTGTDNRYTLEQFSASYNRALAEIRGVIDLNPDPPAISLAGQANALPLSDILRDLGMTANVSGALTLLGGVTVQGETTEALLSNLNGSLAFALDNAVIEGAAYDLLATDLLAWIYSGALTDKSTYLDCTMAKFDLRQGVATTESLYIESAKMVATGSAKFDLVKKRMDVRITPLSKSRLLQVPSEVRLRGDMASPKAEISPISAVADATSAALMLIPSLTLKLFGLNQASTANYRPCQADLAN